MSESASATGGRVVGPNGEVTYDFDGHIRARGLDFDQHVASFHAPEDPGRFTLPAASVSWYRPDGSTSMAMHDDPDVFYIEKGAATTGRAAIHLQVDTVFRNLLDEDGGSDFVQGGGQLVAGASTVDFAGGLQGSAYVFHGAGHPHVAAIASMDPSGTGEAAFRIGSRPHPDDPDNQTEFFFASHDVQTGTFDFTYIIVV